MYNELQAVFLKECCIVKVISLYGTPFIIKLVLIGE